MMISANRMLPISTIFDTDDMESLMADKKSADGAEAEPRTKLK